MPTPTFERIFNRMRFLKEYKIVREMPEVFEFRGKAEYDIIIEDGQITALIWAINETEANQRMDKFLGEYDV